MDRFAQEAFEFVTGPAAREAFDINREDPRLRDRYGRHNWGQSTLLARRLVEAGSTFVTVHFGGWDHHWDLQDGHGDATCRWSTAPSAALFEDLDDRGLLDTTLVVLCGEFSRTPKMNDGGNGGPPRSMGTPGRDHWGNSMFCLMGGGGVKGGQVVGSTDRLGQRPHTPAADAVATSTPPSTTCSASTRSCNCSTRAAGRSTCSTTRRRSASCCNHEQPKNANGLDASAKRRAHNVSGSSRHRKDRPGYGVGRPGAGLKTPELLMTPELLPTVRNGGGVRFRALSALAAVSRNSRPTTRRVSTMVRICLIVSSPVAWRCRCC